MTLQLKKSASKVQVPSSKAHIDYWKTRIYKSNRKGEQSNWFVQLKAHGERHAWSLETPNKDAAARLARNIYELIRVNGWQAARAKYRPGRNTEIKAPEVTVGQFMEEVRRTADLIPKTFEDYARAFRKIVADIAGVDTGNRKYDYRGGGYQEWVEKIYKVKLASLTPKAVPEMEARFSGRSRARPHQPAGS